MSRDKAIQITLLLANCVLNTIRLCTFIVIFHDYFVFKIFFFYKVLLLPEWK